MAILRYFLKGFASMVGAIVAVIFMLIVLALLITL